MAHPRQHITTKYEGSEIQFNDVTEGASNIHEAAISGDVEALTLLVNRQNIDELGSDYYTPLALAAREGHIEAVKFLLRNGAKINLDFWGDDWTALDCAIKNNQVEIVKLLIENGAKINNDALRIATSNNYIEMTKLLLENGALVNNISRFGTSLHTPASVNYVEIVRLLLQYKANVNCLNDDSNTPLQLAAKGKNIEIIRLILGVSEVPDWVRKMPDSPEAKLILEIEKEVVVAAIGNQRRNPASFFYKMPLDIIEYIISPMVLNGSKRLGAPEAPKPSI